MTMMAVLYARVSGEEQVRGYSLRQQLAALRKWCETEGYEVLEEVEDPGHSGAYLERPGLDRVRDLVAEVPGRVAVVVAQDADRITRDPMHRGFLDDELERYGCRLVALDDWGDDSHEGQLLKYMKGWVSKGERLKIAERTRRGLDRKVAEGKVIRGNQAPYGFAYSEDGGTLLVSEPEMRVVRRIFRQVGAEGESMGEVRRRLRDEGVPSAMGGGWPRSTIRYLILNELYWPRGPEELMGAVPADLLAGLDPGQEYGLWTWNKTRVKRWRERGEGGGYRNRVKNEHRPRDEWSFVAVDLSGSGLDRTHVEAARERMAANGRRRPPSTRARRFWLLSGGMARCAHCGNALSPHTSHQRGKIRTYYRCYTRFNHGLDACTNGRSTPAAPLEKAAWEAVRSLCEHPESVLAAYEKHLERRREALLTGSGEAEEERALRERLRKLLGRRSNLIDMGADGTISHGDLRAKLAEADEQREGLERALEETRSRRETAERLRGERELVYRSFAAMRAIDLRHLSSEDRRRVMQALRIGAEVDRTSDVRITGVFGADITELLPMAQAPTDEPYVVRFRHEIPPPTPPHRGVVTVDSTSPCTS